MLASLSDHDRDALAEAYARDGVVRIPNVLAEGAAATLHAELRGRSDWVQVFNSGDKLFELDRATRGDLPASKQAELDLAIYAGARTGFQYRYETIRVPDSREQRLASSDPLFAVAQSLSDGAALETL